MKSAASVLGLAAAGTDYLAPNGSGAALTGFTASQMPRGPVVVALTDGATISVDATAGNHFRVTLGGNRTLANPTGAVDAQKMVFEVIQDGTGSRTLAFGNKFAYGTDITGVALTTTASKRDFIAVVYNSTADKFYIVGFMKGY